MTFDKLHWKEKIVNESGENPSDSSKISHLSIRDHEGVIHVYVYVYMHTYTHTYMLGIGTERQLSGQVYWLFLQRSWFVSSTHRAFVLFWLSMGTAPIWAWTNLNRKHPHTLKRKTKKAAASGHENAHLRSQNWGGRGQWICLSSRSLLPSSV